MVSKRQKHATSYQEGVLCKQLEEFVMMQEDSSFISTHLKDLRSWRSSLCASCWERVRIETGGKGGEVGGI